MSRAQMGFVGYVKLQPKNSSTPTIIRVTSSDLKLMQSIDYPDVVDGKIDQTVYQLGPQVVDGGISFPLIHEISGGSTTNGFPCGDSSNSGSLAQDLWSYATKRDRYGRIDADSVFDCSIRYSDNLGYKYNGCMINTLTYTFREQAAVEVSCNIIGGAGNPTSLRETLIPGTGGFVQSNADAISLLSPARVATWNDVGVGVWGQTSTGNTTEELINFSDVTEFTCTVNNNIERIYSLNNKLSPVDIVAKKRVFEGELEVLGGQYKLTQNTYSNDQRFTSNASIAFGYRLGGSTNYYWATGLYGVVFEIETMGLSNNLFKTRTKWRALGDCDNKHLGTKLGTTTTPIGDKLPEPGSNNYGNQTAPNYPTFDSYNP